MATISVWVEKYRRKQRVRYRDTAGKVHDIWPISIWDTKSEANRAKKEWLKNHERKALGETNSQTPIQMLFDRWLVDSRAGLANKKGLKIKEGTIKSYRSSFAYLLKNINELGQLDNEMVKEFVRHLANRYKPWTCHRRLVDLKSFCSYLKRQKLINWDPFENVPIRRPPTKPRFYSDEEIMGFEQAAVALGDLWSLLYLRLGYQCGLRHGEASGIKIEDVRRDPEGQGWGLLTIWETESKTEESRVVPLPPTVMEVVLQLVGKRSQGLIFEGWSQRRFEFRWNRLVAKSGLRPADWYVNDYKWAQRKELKDRGETPYHGLRHTFCRRWVENGGDISELKEITGHKSIEVLINTYAHFAKRHIHKRAKEVYEKMEMQRPLVGHGWGKITEIIETERNLVELSGTLRQPTRKEKYS